MLKVGNFAPPALGTPVDVGGMAMVVDRIDFASRSVTLRPKAA